MGNDRGQTLIEFVILVPMISLTIVGTGWILREANRRTECTRIVFEAVRSRLEGRIEATFLDSGGKLRSNENGVEGELKCGNHTERLFLPEIGRRKPGASRSPSFY